MSACATESCSAQNVGKSKYCAEHKAEAYAAWKKRIAESSAEREVRYEGFSIMENIAEKRGIEALSKAVSEAGENPLDQPVKVAFVHPKGNTSFAHWAKKHRGWSTSTYSKGVRRVIEWDIPLQGLFAYAEAYCETFVDEDIDVQYVMLNQ